MDRPISFVVGYFKKINAFLVYAKVYAFMQVFTISGVYIKAFGNWKIT